MEPDNIPARVHEIVGRLAPSMPAIVADGDHFIDDLEFHSLALVELGFGIEEAFGLEPISADEVEHVTTVGDLVTFVRRRCAEF